MTPRNHLERVVMGVLGGAAIVAITWLGWWLHVEVIRRVAAGVCGC